MTICHHLEDQEHSPACRFQACHSRGPRMPGRAKFYLKEQRPQRKEVKISNFFLEKKVMRNLRRFAVLAETVKADQNHPKHKRKY